MSVIDILAKYQEALISGLWVTFQLCLIIWSSGLLIGAALGILGVRFKRSIGLPTRFLSFFLSGVPILVFLYWMHYPFQSLLGIVVDPFITASLTFSIVNIFAIASIFRNAITRELPSQFIEAAKVCGLDRRTRLLKIEIPLVVRNVLPPYLISQVNMLHASLFASLITVNEIFKTAQSIISYELGSPVEVYTVLGIFFLLISLPINGVAYLLRLRFGKDISEK